VVLVDRIANKYTDHGLFLPKIRVVPNPIFEQLMNVVHQPSNDKAEKRLLGVGRLDEGKQFSVLIRVFAKLANRHSQWSLRILGEGYLRADLQQQIVNLGLESSIELAGAVSAIENELAKADIFALTSKYEGFSMVLLEAMVVGLPCVSFDCPSGPRELSMDGQVALLVPLNDEQALELALERLMLDADLRQTLGCQARASVIERFSLSKILDHWDFFSRTRSITLKILHIIVALDIGGAETVLKRLIESDPVSIPNTILVSLTSLGAIGESLRNQGVTVHTLKLSRSGFNIPAVMWQLVKLIRQYQPDIVQTWMYHADLLGGLAARLAGYKNIIWGIRHTTLSLKDSTRTVFIMKICAVLSHWIPKKIVCVAEAAKQVHSVAGYDVKRMVVIPNGFDFSKLTATQEQGIALRLACHFSENELVIGCVGRFHPDKGQNNFINAAVIIAQHYPMAKFLLVGRNCDVNNAQLMKWLNDNSLKEHFFC